MVKTFYMITKIDLHIAQQIKRLREVKKLTGKELSDMLGLKSHVSVTRMEQGKQSFTTSNIYLLCSIFNVTPNDLFPPIKNATIVKQKRKVTVVPKIFTVSNLPQI